MQSSTKVIAVLIAVAILVFIGVTRAKQPVSIEPVRIGALLPLTGGLASYGEPAQKMMILAMDEVNATGGIHGQRLEVLFQDHMCKPAEAVSAFQQLSATGIKIFTSAACSGIVLAVAPQLPAHDALLLGTIVTTPKVTGVSPFVFRNWASDRTEAKLFADEIVKRGAKKVAVLYEETDYAKGLKLSLEEFLQNTGSTVVSGSFKTGDTDVRSQLVKLQAIEPDVLFLSPQSVTSGDIILGQLEKLPSFRPFLIVNDNIAKSTELLAKYPVLLEGAISGDYILEDTPVAQAILARYKATYGTDCSPTNICVGVYDAIQLLAAAAKHVGADTKAIQKYLSTVTYAGASGEISFDVRNDRAHAVYQLLTIKDKTAIPLR